MGDAVWLQQAKDSLATGDKKAALERLLWAYVENRHHRLADVICTLGTELAATQPALTPANKTKKAILEAWLTRARQSASDPSVTSILLGTLAEGSAKDALTRLSHFAASRPDPRIARTIASLFVSPPFLAGTTRTFWQLAANIMPTHADTTTHQILSSVSGTMLTVLQGNDTLGEFLEHLITQMLRNIPNPQTVTLSQTETDILSAIETMPRLKTHG